MKALFFLALTIATSWAPLACAADVIRIGVITARSGVFALQGTSGERGEIMAMEEINKRGGVNGKQIEFISGDSKSNPEEASRLFRDFASKGVAAVIANAGSAETMAISSLTRTAKIPVFTMMGYGRSLTEEFGHRYFFRTIVNSRGFTTPLAQRMGRERYRTYCAINNDYALGHDVNESFFAELRSLKPEVEVLPGCEFWVPLGATDFTSYITAILSKKPDVVVFSGLVGPGARAFVAQARNFGLFKSSVGAHASLGWPGNNDGLRKQEIPENIVTATDYPYPIVQRPESTVFFSAFKTRWKELPLSEAAYGWAAVNFMADAFAKAKSEDTEAFITAAESTIINHPAAGPLKLRAFDHQAEMGVWVGTLAWDEVNNRPGMDQIQYVQPSTFLPTAEELEKIRSKAAK